MTNEIIALVILAACIVGFITNRINSCVVAALGCVAFAMTGICSFEEAFSGFSNSIVILVFGALVVGDAMVETGVDKMIGRFVVRVSRDNERLFIFVAALVSGLMSMWMANTAVVSCFLPIIASVSHTSSKMTMKNMTMGITFGAMFGGSCTLIGSTPQLTAQGLMLEMTDVQFSMFDFMPVGLILMAAYLVWEQAAGYRLGIKIWGDRPLEGIAELEAGPMDMDHKVDRKQVTILAVIFVLMVVSYVTEWIPSALTAITAALACMVTGCADPKVAIRRMDWNCVLFLACCLGIAKGLSATNIAAIFADMITHIFGGEVNPVLFFAVVVSATILVSNFIANSTTVIIFLPVVVSACQSYGFNVLPFCMGIVYAANLACATPLAHAQVTMTMVAGYRFTDYLKANLPVNILTVIILVIFTPIFFPLV